MTGPESYDIMQIFQEFQQELQSIIYQKEAMRMHLQELEASLKELSAAKSDVYKAMGAILIKATPELLAKELNDERELIEVRTKSLEKQEKIVREKLTALQNQVIQSQAARSGAAIPGSGVK
ncbi:MAG: prefoldin subunit beta [Nanoarchaeota archaeon]|nr:prefoldin subunit beta [Nanoarchaeota archaeon]MBU4299780.1 prefoldin subunit beta [Nanoarchaeota archaeon]MBU4452090.1 prefoldin subunit beta [Nanoarchaeota archaeon]MCG2723164.1 prefoldin subunit beta [archaeon]